ncbi:hypothetical protein IJT93_12945 [bacterium]|nr:hypothetical protein [bacterium]
MKAEPAEEGYKTVEFHYVVDPGSSLCLDERVQTVSYYFSHQNTYICSSLHNTVSRVSPDDFARVRAENIPINAADVTAVYFDEFGNIVGIGRDHIHWDEKNSNCAVDVPSYYRVDGGAVSLSLTVSSYKIPVGEYLRFTAFLDVNGDVMPMDVTDLTEFSNVDSRLLIPAKDKNESDGRKITPGYYLSEACGVCTQVKASIKTAGGVLEDVLHGAVYITDSYDSLEVRYRTDGEGEYKDIVKGMSSVRYNFLNERGECIFFTDYIGLKDKISGDGLIKVTLCGVPTASTKICAAYYDSGRRLAAVGIDEIFWKKEGDVERSSLEQPSISLLDKERDNIKYKLTADKYALNVKDKVRLRASVRPGKAGFEVDITPFVEFYNFESSVLCAIKDKFEKTNSVMTPGYYSAISIGETEGCAFIEDSLGIVKLATENRITVGREELKNLAFNYVRLSGDKELDDKIASVRYNFTDNRGRCLLLTDYYPIYKNGDDFSLCIGVENIPAGAVEVNAFYYGEGGGEILACGCNEINWGDGTLSVDEPVVCRPGKVKGRVLVSNYVISPGEVFNIRAFVIPENSDFKWVEATPLINVEGIGSDDIIQALEKKMASRKRFVYKGVKYGVKSDLKAVFDDVFSVNVSDIYITDQKAEELEIVPADIDGQPIYLFYNQDNTAESYLLYVDNDKFGNSVVVKNDLGQKIASVDCGDHVENVAVNKQAYKVRVNYSHAEGKGPTPESVDMTRYTQFSAEAGVNVKLSVEKNVLTVNGLPSETDSAVISVFGDFRGLKNKAVCRVVRAESHLALFNESDTLGGILSVPYGKYAGQAFVQNLFLKGFFEMFDGKRLCTMPFEIPASLLEDRGYPEIAFEGEEDDNVEFYQDKDSYSIKVYIGAVEQVYLVYVKDIPGLPDCIPVKYQIYNSEFLLDE